MIIIDTNVISELLRPNPEPAVEAWLCAQDGLSIYLTTISEAELRYGVAIIIREDMTGRILPFDSAAAHAYGIIGATRRTAGRSIAQADCQIAAIALAHGAPVATRNTPDFEGCGIDLINPWTAA
jgi:predicted nucleic acid-binding protein